MTKIKSDEVSIVQAHSQGFFLLVNPPIRTSCPALVELGLTLIHIHLITMSHMTVLLEFESKEFWQISQKIKIFFLIVTREIKS